LSSGEFKIFLMVCPGVVLVVAGAGFEAAVEDADQPIGQLPQRGAVAGSSSAEPVVVGAGDRGMR